MEDEQVIEAGEDGTFDLGNPSAAPLAPPPPPSDPVLSAAGGGGPTLPVPPVGPNEASTDEDQDHGFEDAVSQPPSEGAAAGAADTGLHVEPGAEQLQEDWDSSGGVTAPADVGGRGGAEAASGTPGVCSSEATGWIAAGLANVAWPLPSARWHVPCSDAPALPEEDSEGEDEFHDTLDGMAGLTKDANKAREMKELGNGCYKSREFQDAADYYSMALEYCPQGEDDKEARAVYFCNRAACYLQLGEFDSVVEDCTAAMELQPKYVKALMRRAQANENLEKYDAALEDVNAALAIDPSLRVARESAPRLEKLHKEKMDHMKDEAIGKLKELGNSVLGHFGLSIDNFKVNQDENGSYSINFQR